jgi:hypothetical protein
MATTAGFKQQCPSCEAWVPVRDTNLIGKKIDCPKCKYRFVVEDPGEEVEAEEEEEERPAKASKRPRRAAEDEEDEEEEAPRVKSKSKAGPRRGEDEEEDEGKEKKAGASPKLILAIGGGVLAVGVLGAVAYFIFGGDSKPPAAASNVAVNAPKAPPPETPAETKPASSSSATAPEVATNLLPGDVEGLCTFRMSDLPITALGKTMFSGPSALQYQIFKDRLGLSLEDVDLVLQAWNFSKNWSFNVVHTKGPIDAASVKKALNLTPAPKKIAEQEYFLVGPNPWLDELGRQTFALLTQVDHRAVPAATRPLALRYHDQRTLIIANVEQLEAFLKVKGKFANQSQAPSTTAAASTKTSGSGSGSNMMGAGNARGNTKAPPPSGKKEEAAAPAGPSSYYLTINPKLKKMMDRVDTRRPTLSLAIDTQAASAGHVPPLGLNTLNLGQNLVKDGDYVGLALNVKDQLSFLIAVDFPAEEIANARLEAYRKELGAALAKRIGSEFKIEVVMVGAEEKPAAPAASTVSPPPRGRVTPGVAGGGGGARQQATPPGTPPQMGAAGLKPEKEIKVSRVEVVVEDKTVVLLEVRLVDASANYNWVRGRMKQLVLQQKGQLDMASRQLRIFELAKALHTYTDTHAGEFPRGALERQVPATRAGRPYPPEQRLSWLVGLLPNLGTDGKSLFGRIDPQKSWRDPPDNILAAGTLVPAFINPNSPPESWWVRYAGMPDEVAVTNFLGVAGVGLDAADYRTDDTSVTGKLGIFGYERTTKISDISDGAANTIAVIQVPSNFKRPWLAGGGCTVTGIPEKDCIKPFVSTMFNGKRGTLVIMADGTVRFISEKISDEAFKALCTIKGGEAVIIDRDAPKVPQPDEDAEIKIEAISMAEPSQPVAPGRSPP